MLFTSYTFLLFLLGVFVIYYILPSKAQWVFLLMASLVFYCFAGWQYLFYILFTGISTYIFARVIQSKVDKQKEYIKLHKQELSKEERKAYKEKKKKVRGIFLFLCLLLNFGILGVIKYSNFCIGNINGIFGGQIPLHDWVLPLGISFYTFQTMGYIIDVYREKYEAEKNPFKLMLFVSFFPQLIQGPISRFDELSESLFAGHKFNWHNIVYGGERILWGFFKKLVIADRMLVGVNALIGDTDTYRGFYVVIGAIFYALELYADFTGGIDITIGVAEVLGIKVVENFHRPFFSKGIKEYWRRWHISLGTWFTDYVFYPISVCKPMLKATKWCRNHLGEYVGKRLTVYVATITVWLITGIWHGAAWNFIVWGLGNCVFIIIEQETEGFVHNLETKYALPNKLWYKIINIIKLNAIMCCLRMFDCYRDVPMTFKMFGSIFTTFNIGEVMRTGLWQLGLTNFDYIVLLIGACLLFMVSFLGRKVNVREKINSYPAVVPMATFGIIFIAIIMLGAYGIGYDASQFIYNQF